MTNIKHPSYGLVQFNRVNGRFDNLFGTEVETGTAIALRIKRASFNRDLNRRWYSEEEELIEVYLSPNQFSELLTTMNVGVGVPATITHIGGKRCGEAPREKSEPEHIRDEFSDKVTELMDTLKGFSSKVEEILNKKTLTKADKDEIRTNIAYFKREIGANMPYVLESFNESTEKIAQEAKSVADAFLTNMIATAGLKALKGEEVIVTPTIEKQDKAMELARTKLNSMYEANIVSPVEINYILAYDRKIFEKALRAHRTDWRDAEDFVRNCLSRDLSIPVDDIGDLLLNQHALEVVDYLLGEF